MPSILTIEGIDDRGPGKQYTKPRGLREVVEVQPSRKDPSLCVIGRFGPPGAAKGKRMVDLCREAGLNRMRAGGRTIEIGSGTRSRRKRNTDMADYNETEFPPIEDLEDLDALIPPGYLMDNLKALGAHVAARTLADVAKAIPWQPKYSVPAAKVLAGLAGGRLLWGLDRDVGLITTSTLLGSALYDNLLKPMVLSRLSPTLFGGVDVPEERILGQLTDEERALLDGGVEESDYERRLSGAVEEDDISISDAVSDTGRNAEVEVSDFNNIGNWIQ